jgi:hypothetical protein
MILLDLIDYDDEVFILSGFDKSFLIRGMFRTLTGFPG